MYSFFPCISFGVKTDSSVGKTKVFKIVYFKHLNLLHYAKTGTGRDQKIFAKKNNVMYRGRVLPEDLCKKTIQKLSKNNLKTTCCNHRFFIVFPIF